MSFMNVVCVFICHHECSMYVYVIRCFTDCVYEDSHSIYFVCHLVVQSYLM